MFGADQHNQRIWTLAFVVVCTVCASASGATYTVGPATANACGGVDCDYQSIQAAINAALANDIITVYRRTDDATNNYCYNEHITINKSGLTLQGSSTTPADVACIGTSTAGDIVRITASTVTLKNFQISGKANNGAGGLNSKNKGGRHLGAGVRIYGNDIDGVVIENCTIAFTMEENIRWQGDLNGDNNGNVTIRKCYLHHSDLPKDNVRIDGGSNATDVHLVEDNYMTTGQGVYSDAEYITVQKNIILGYPYWAHMVNNGTWPETHDYNSQSANYGGGWRYFSRCDAGVWIANGGAGTDIQILNNLIIGTKIGIRVQTTGTINNNTVANPFNVPPSYGYSSTIDATAIRDATYGIMLVSGFAGTLQNNIVVVTEDNRATGQPGKATAPYYSPGITGYGIGFSGGSGSLGAGASVRNNDVWGFVDTDGSTATNWGSGLSTCEDNTDSKCSSNLSVDPVFATDTSDETNDGSGGCDADIVNTRCYELYGDNFFLSTTGSGGSCHADIRPNTASYVGFVDMTSTSDLAGLGDCSAASDASDSPLIDWGTGAVGSEPGSNGGAPNLGAFGGTGRAAQSGPLKIVGIDVGDGGVKSNNNSYTGPGIVQARSNGITEVNVYFNRAVTVGLSNFRFRNICDTADLATAPTIDTSAATAAPYKVKFTWPASTYTNQGIRIHALGDGVDRIVDSDANALDGEISDVVSGTVPSGNGTAGGDAEFVVYSLIGDVDGDMDVDTSDRTDVNTLDNSTTSGLPEDIDGDGTVEGASGEDDYVAADTRLAAYWVDSTADTASATTLRYALTNVANNEDIRFDIDTFDTCRSATIDVDTSALPALSNTGVTIDASVVDVVIEDTDSDLPDGDDGLYITGSSNTVYGLQIQNFDAGTSSYGIYITGASNVIGGTGTGQGNTITGNGATGIYATGASADNNTWRGNLIYDNTGIAVDLAGDGANNDIAAPAITLSCINVVSGTSSQSDGTNIDVYTNVDGDTDSLVFAGSSTVSSGAWSVVGLGLTVGQYAVAIQTDSSGNSSEVSSAAIVATGGSCADYIVDTTSDENDGSCGDGDCSLRDALLLVANGETIAFHGGIFPLATPATISPSSGLPDLDDGSVTLDASSTGVIIDGTSAGAVDGLSITSASNTVKGLQIQNFNKDGIHISAASNTIGTTTSGEGNTLTGNGSQGIEITTATSDFNTLRGNLIYDNGAAAIVLANGTNDDIPAPAITSAKTNTITGTSAEADGTFVDVYSNVDGDTDCLVFVGSTTVSSAAWSLTGLSLTAGEYTVAIHTDSSGNSSEVSSVSLILALCASSLCTVDTTTDENDGDCSDGDCSLRDALQLAVSGDTIAFNTSIFPSGTPATISPSSALPALDDGNVTIDASNAGVIIDGTSAGAVEGLTISSDSNTVKGLQIQNFNKNGIAITGASNTIGTTTAGEGNTITGNGSQGIELKTAASDFNTLRGNLIYDNNSAAIVLALGSNDDISTPAITSASLDTVTGTSTEADGTIIDVYSNADGDTDCLVFLGSTTVSSSAWTLTSLSLSAGDYAVAIQTDASGNSSQVSSASSQVLGICVSSLCTVDTTTDENDGDCSDGDCSLRDALLLAVSGDTIDFDTGVFPSGTPATISPSSALPALDDGNVTIDASNAGVIIDGTSAGGADGLSISSDSNTVKGLVIQNFGSDGIIIIGSSNTIGTTTPGEGNTLTGNGSEGIEVKTSTSDFNTLRGNLIYDNNAAAIKLGTGTNDDISAATITLARQDRVTGTSTEADGTIVDVYSNVDGDSDCLVFAGSTTVSSGAWSVTGLSLTAGDYTVAIQTDSNGNSSAVSSASSPVVIICTSSLCTVDTTTDENDGDCGDGDCSLRDALQLAGDGDTIAFDTGVFPPATPATISVSGSALPALDDGNVIIDASNAGVIIDGTSAGSVDGLSISSANNTVKGLQILNFAGDGIYITGNSNTIGGNYNGAAANKLGDGCLLSANDVGIRISGGSSNTVKGCLIGTNLAGTAGSGNTVEGILVSNTASSNTFGGSSAAARNVISANGSAGIRIKDSGSDSNVVKGNYIGTDVGGTADLGNGANGITVSFGAASTTIGSTTSGEENLVVYNTGVGISLTGQGDLNTWRANLIYDNTGIAVTLSGAGDNDDITAPTITSMNLTQVAGTSTEADGTIVDVFTNLDGDTDCLVYVGNTTVSSGAWSLTGLSLNNDDYGVAIQTDASGNSSEVSAAWRLALEVVYCYNAYAAGWETNPAKMTDCATGNSAETATDTQVQELTAHTLEQGSEGSGTIFKVEVRYSGARANGPGDGTNNRASVTPVFGGATDGDTHDPGAVLLGAASWINWLDITNDTNAPAWTWTDITNLDMDIDAMIISGGRVKVGKIELRVTYVP